MNHYSDAIRYQKLATAAKTGSLSTVAGVLRGNDLPDGPPVGSQAGPSIPPANRLQLGPSDGNSTLASPYSGQTSQFLVPKSALSGFPNSSAWNLDVTDPAATSSSASNQDMANSTNGPLDTPDSDSIYGRGRLDLTRQHRLDAIAAESLARFNKCVSGKLYSNPFLDPEALGAAATFLATKLQSTKMSTDQMAYVLRNQFGKGVLANVDNIIERAQKVAGAMMQNPPTSYGDQGATYPQFAGRAADAINFMRFVQHGDATGALYHPAIGAIDLPYGEPERVKTGVDQYGRQDSLMQEGYGLSKIVQKHPEVLSNLQGLLSNMTVSEDLPGQLTLRYGPHIAVVSRQFDGADKTWLKTAYNSALRQPSTSNWLGDPYDLSMIPPGFDPPNFSLTPSQIDAHGMTAGKMVERVRKIYDTRRQR